MPNFQYHSMIVAQFPDLVSGIIFGEGMTNAPTSDQVSQLYTAEQQAVAARIGTNPLSEIPALAAWRQAFRKFGTDLANIAARPKPCCAA